MQVQQQSFETQLPYFINGSCNLKLSYIELPKPLSNVKHLLWNKLIAMYLFCNPNLKTRELLIQIQPSKCETQIVISNFRKLNVKYQRSNIQSSQ